MKVSTTSIAVFVSICVMAYFFADSILSFRTNDTPVFVMAPSQDGVKGGIMPFMEKVETYDIVTGQGEAATPGSNVVVRYKGWFEENGVPITFLSEDIPLAFTLGRGEVISGWETGLLGMKEGGTRRVKVPPEFGYGRLGLKDRFGDILIPPNTALVFEIWLLSVSQ